MQILSAPFRHLMNDAEKVIETLQSPLTVEIKQPGSSSVLVAALAAIGCAFLLIVILAIRQGVRIAANSPEGREKLKKLPKSVRWIP